MHNPDILQALNPADSFTLALDQQIRNEAMPGSLCGFALELEQHPDAERLQSRITEFCQRFPLATASLQQRGKKFYWCRRTAPKQILFQHRCPPQEDESAYLKHLTTTIINQREARDAVAPLEFHLLAGRTRHLFLLRWIHPLCDARGADLILKYLCTDDPGLRRRFDTPAGEPLVNTFLAKFSWWQKVALFFKARHYILQIDRQRSIVPPLAQQAPQRLNYTIRRLTETQTAAIAEQSRRHLGLTGTSLYYIGCLMRALQKINPTGTGDAYCVPYAFNLRKQKSLSPLLGNHVCALFAQAPRDTVQNREQLFAHLKSQMNDVIRRQLDYAFLPLMWAGSWLTLEKYGNILRHSYRTGTERASFWFSDIGTSDLSNRQFFGASINGLFHLCQVTSPPALALLSCQHQNRLTLTYNFIEPLVNEPWIDQLHELMLAELLGEC